MSGISHTFTRTSTVVIPANPYLRCVRCGARVEYWHMTDLAPTRVAETLARHPTSASASCAVSPSPLCGSADADHPSPLAAAVPGEDLAGASRVMPDASQSVIPERDHGKSCAIQAPAAAAARTTVERDDTQAGALRGVDGHCTRNPLSPAGAASARGALGSTSSRTRSRRRSAMTNCSGGLKAE